MRILYDHQIFAAQRWGGVSRYFAELALQLARTETVAIHAPIHVSQCLDEVHPPIIHGARLPVFPGVTVLANAVARLSRPSRPFDIYHPTWYNTRGWRPRGASVVHSVYDMIAELFPDERGIFKRQAALKRQAVLEADMIFCISHSTKKDLTSIIDINPEKVLVTHLGSTIQLISPRKLSAENPYILYVGQRAGYKNFISLLSAFKSSSRLRADFGLVCFGGGPFSKVDLDVIGDLHGQGCGTVSNFQGDDALLAGAYRGAAVFVCPSRYEGFGMPVLEAMACGCPVVATPLSSLPEVGGDAVTYAADSSAEAIREALEGLLFDQPAIRQAKERGVARAQAYSWESTASTTLAGYRIATA